MGKTPRNSEERETSLNGLLDAAFEVFAAHGYRASRLESVAAAAGVTKGAIYYHFEGKEDLLRRAVQRRHRTLFAELAERLASEPGPFSMKIRLALRGMWGHWLEPGPGRAIRLLLGEVSVELPSLFQLWVEEGPMHAWSMVRELIEAGVAAGEFRPDVDAEVASRVIVSGLMLQATMQIHLGLEELAPCDPDRLFDSAVDVFLHGLVTRGGSPVEAYGDGRSTK